MDHFKVQNHPGHKEICQSQLSRLLMMSLTLSAGIFRSISVTSILHILVKLTSKQLVTKQLIVLITESKNKPCL